MTIKVFPIGGFWDAEEIRNVNRFYTRIHHKIPQMVVVYWDNDTHRQGTKYIDLSLYSVQFEL